MDLGNTKTQTKSVLLIEDDLDYRSSLQFKLSQEGFTVYEAGDGKAGLDIAHVHHPDIIVLDLIIPKMSGVEFLSELTKDKWGKDARVVILSNLSHLTSLYSLYENNIVAYLVKMQVNIDDIVQQIKETI